MNNNNSFRNGIQKFQILYLYLYSQIPMPTQESIIIANLFLLFLNGIKRHDTIKKKKRVFTSSCSFFVSFFSISFRSSQTKFFEFYFLLPLLIWLIDCNQSFFFQPNKNWLIGNEQSCFVIKITFYLYFFLREKKTCTIWMTIQRFDDDRCKIFRCKIFTKLISTVRLPP